MANPLQAILNYLQNRNKVSPTEYTNDNVVEKQQKVAGAIFNKNLVSPQDIRSWFPQVQMAPPNVAGYQPTPTPTPTPTPPSKNEGVEYSPRSQAFLNDVVLPITRKYNVPDALAAGQFAAEGRLGGLGAKRNNYYNIAAYDSNPDQAYTYDNPQQGIEAYAKLLHTDRYKKALEMADVLQALIYIQNARYAGDPATYDARSPNDYPSYSSFVQDTPEWKKYYQP